MNSNTLFDLPLVVVLKLRGISYMYVHVHVGAEKSGNRWVLFGEDMFILFTSTLASLTTVACIHV